jgi:hypothetical protein
LAIICAITAITNGVSVAQSVTPKQFNPHFSVTISASNKVVKAGSPVDLKIRMTNTSNSEISLGAGIWVYGNINPFYTYDCRDEKGKLVKKDYAVVATLGDRAKPTLKPGEFQEEIITVSNACDLSRLGKYTIEVSTIDRDDAKHRLVSSNMITVTVTD